MVKNTKFCELENMLAPIGYKCYNRDANSITFVLNRYCVWVSGTVVDSGDSLSLTVVLNFKIKAKTYSETNVSDIINIMTRVLENVKELDAKAHKKVDSFDTVLYPVGVGISKDNSNTFYVKVICDLANYIRGVTLIPVYEYNELVTCLTKVKDSINADMVGDLESELSSVACNYLKGVLNYEG